MTPDPIGALLALVSILEELDVTYAIGGSVASSVHGEPRASADADLLAELTPQQLDELVERLAEDFYVSVEAAREALQRRSSFNVIHLESTYKLDIFVAGASQMDRDQLGRRISVNLTRDPGSSAYVTAAEDIVVRKLDWYHQTGETSDKQWRDVLGVLKVQASRLDMAHLRRAAAEANVLELLEKALAMSKPD